MTRLLLWVILALTLALGVQTVRLERLRVDLATAETAVFEAKLGAALEALALGGQSNKATLAVGVASEKARVEIRYQTRTVIEKVPVYVTAETNVRYPLPWGLVRLHDAAVTGADPAALPNPSGAPDGEASTVTAADLSRTFAFNYGECRDYAQLLSDWQAWYAEAAALWNGEAAP